MLDAGPWLRCFACGWNGARDYVAAINIALLGVAYLKQSLHSFPSSQDDRPTMTQKGLNSESYSGSGLARQRAANVPSGPPDRVRKAVRQWLGQLCDAAFCTATTYHASLVWIATARLQLDLPRRPS
jgi:hypothetical protein